MKFEELVQRARNIRRQYAEYEKKCVGSEWDGQDLMLGFVGDVGDLAKLVAAKEGRRLIDNVDEKIEHELADCMWSIIVLSEKYGIDLEKVFLKTMDELEDRLDGGGVK